MPQVVMTRELRLKKLRRTLVFGPPNSFKTTSILQTAVYPLTIISPPGEDGWGTIPDTGTVKGLQSYVWEETPSDPVSAESMRAEIEGLAFKMAAGMNGPVRTLAIDGFHQMYNSIYLNIASAGAYGRGEDFEAQRYARAHAMAQTFIRKLLNSPVEYVIFTTWNGRELDKPGIDNKSAHEWPEVPGKMAKLIVGCFSVVVFARVVRAQGKLVGEWQLRPDMESWGSSYKCDPRIIEKIPAKVPQDFKNLYAVIGAAQQEVEKGGE